MATGQIGTATILVRVDLQQYARDMARLRALTAQAANVAGNSFKRIDQSTRRTSIGVQALSRQFLVLRAAVAAAVSVSGVRNIAAAADAWALMQSKLMLVSDSAAAAAGTLERLFGIAQSSRSDLSATVDLFFKLSSASGELGISQEQVIRITESMNQLFKVGSVDAVRAAQATIQLTQSLTKQRIAGDELRTIHEAFPDLLRLIATEMTKAGNTTSAYELSTQEGGIAVKDFLGALESAGPEIARMFKLVPVTISDAVTTISNTLTRAIGATSQASGAYKELVISLGDLEDSLGSADFQKGLGLFLTLLVDAAATVVSLTQVLGGLTAEIRALGEEAGKHENLKALWDAIAPGDLVANTEREVGTIINAFKSLRESLTNYNAVQILPPNMLRDLRAAGVTFDELGEIIKDDRRKMVEFGAAAAATNAILRQGEEVSEEIIDAQKEYRDSLKDTIGVLVEEGEQAFEDYLDRQEEAADKLQETADAVTDLQNQLALEKIPEDYRELNSIFQDLGLDVTATKDGIVEGETATKAQVATASQLFEIWQAILKVQKEAALVKTVDVRSDEEANRRLRQQQAQETKDEAEKTAEEATKAADKEREGRIASSSRLPDDIDVANIAAQELASTLTDLDNLSFESLGEAFLNIGQQIAELVLRALIFKAVMAGMNAAMGGAGAGAAGAGASFGATAAGGGSSAAPLAGGIPQFARGGIGRFGRSGIVNRPTIVPMALGGALIGEAGTEAVLPLKRMAGGDLGVAAEGGGSGSVINIDARQSTPGTAAAAVSAALKMAPGAVVNAQARGRMGKQKAPW